MKVDKLLEIIGSDFYTGVPDSQLKALINHLMDTYGIDPKHHVIAANEGNCAALAAGYHLATGKVPVVYGRTSEQKQEEPKRPFWKFWEKRPAENKGTSE